jgi:hypothetical protein
MTTEEAAPTFNPIRPNPVAIARFFKTANERHSIYLKRAKNAQPPWTNDPVFRHYRFCNVYRELDRVTVWLREKWREPYANHPNLMFAMAVARLINWPDTLEEIGFPTKWKPNRVYDILTDRKARGEKVFTSAYLLGGGVLKGQSRAEHLVYNMLDPLYKDPVVLQKGSSLRDAWELYRKRTGIGPFLAYEIVTDLRHTDHLRNASDIMVWANPGPGAIRGLCRLYGIPVKGRKRGDRWQEKMPDARNAMRYLLQESKRHLGRHMPPWEMREVEHWLCEFDKYSRVLDGGTLDKFRPYMEDQGRLF